MQTRARFHLSADCRAPYIDTYSVLHKRDTMLSHRRTWYSYYLELCIFKKKKYMYVCILTAIRVNPLSPSIPLDRSRRMRNVATRTKEPRSRCPAAILIHKSQGAPWSRSGTSERQTSRLIEPRRVLTRGGSVLKPLSSVKDHRKPVRLPSRPLGQLRARSRYPSSSRKPVCPRHRRRYIHLCFSLYTIELLLASSSRFLNHARRVEITMI